jgi:hypothetical protein
MIAQLHKLAMPGPARTSMQVTVSTLWEAAWAEIELPR